jgi:GAF domain-containing protein
MRSRVWRFLVLVILLGSGGGAAWLSWVASQQLLQLDKSQRDLNDRVDRLLATLDTVVTAQQSYVTPYPEQDPSRVPELIGQVRSDTERLRPDVRSIEAGRALQSVAAAVATLQDVEARAQEHVRLGQDLMASDLIFSEGRASDEAIASGLRMVRAGENEAYATARADTLDLLWTVAIAVATLWTLGLILLVRMASPAVREDAPSFAPAHSLLAISPPLEEPAPAAHPDLQTAADVCTAMGRLNRAEDLPELLQQAATVLNASGVVVWMAAGEELFAAAAFGYPAQVIRKLGPINRSAINATAAAWRTNTLQAVSGDHGTRGALAAPMLGPDRCIGVLAVEVAEGQDTDAATRAVTMMFAAQLAAALAGWPAASAAAPVTVPPLDTAAEA